MVDTNRMFVWSIFLSTKKLAKVFAFQAQKAHYTIIAKFIVVVLAVSGNA